METSNRPPRESHDGRYREYAAWSLAAILLTVLGHHDCSPWLEFSDAAGSTLSYSQSIRLRVEPSEARGHRFRQRNWRLHLMAAIWCSWLRARMASPDCGSAHWMPPRRDRSPVHEDATDPFWSPDSRNVAFFARGALRRVDLNGGAPQVLSPATINTRGGSWSSSGVILFNPENLSGLMRVPESGGTAVGVDPNAENLKLGGGR